jgi:hypothetical protein
MGENLAGNPVDQAGLADWAQEFDLHHPVVSDPNWGVTVGYTGYSIGLPAMHQLAAGGVIPAALHSARIRSVAVSP